MGERKTHAWLLAGLGATALGSGCGVDSPQDPFATGTGSAASGTPPAGSADDAPGEGLDDTAGSAAEGGQTEDDDEPKFDVGSGADVPGIGNCGENPDAPECEGCNAVDILFVVDNSGSMQQHAPAVNAAFDEFVDTMVSALPPATSLHVGLTRGTGFYDPGNSGGFGNGCEGFTDGVWNPPDTGTNTGTNGHQGRLWEQNGQRFFELTTGQDPSGLSTWFGAALEGSIDPIANYSNSETVVAGAAYALHPVNADTNAGFLREQAVLVIFLLSDSPDLSPADVPTSDFVTIVSDAKSACGDMCILTTGAISAGCYDQPGITNTRLFDFMNGFGGPPVSYVEMGGQSTPDLAPVLGDALSNVIAETCQNIPPAG